MKMFAELQSKREESLAKAKEEYERAVAEIEGSFQKEVLALAKPAIRERFSGVVCSEIVGEWVSLTIKNDGKYKTERHHLSLLGV